MSSGFGMVRLDRGRRSLVAYTPCGQTP